MLGHQLPAFAGLRKEELIAGFAGRVAARPDYATKLQAYGEKCYVREKEAATKTMKVKVLYVPL